MRAKINIFILVRLNVDLIHWLLMTGLGKVNLVSMPFLHIELLTKKSPKMRAKIIIFILSRLKWNYLKNE